MRSSGKWLNTCEIFTILAGLFFLFWGMCTPEWRQQRQVVIETYEGLWKRCIQGECVDFSLVNTSGK